jgi:hypothetical protein
MSASKKPAAAPSALAAEPTLEELARALEEAKAEHLRAWNAALAGLAGLLGASAALLQRNDHATSAPPLPAATGGRLAAAQPAPVSPRQGLFRGAPEISTRINPRPKLGSP